MLNNDANPNTLSRLELLKLAQTLRVSDADVMTRAELRAAIERAKRSDQRPPAPPVTWLGVARRLLASIVEQGLHLPDAAAVIRGPVSFRPTPSGPPPVATVTLARIYAAQGHLVRALGTLDEVLESDPDHDLARDLRAQLQARLAEQRAQERQSNGHDNGAAGARPAPNGSDAGGDPSDTLEELESSPASELLEAVPPATESEAVAAAPSPEEITLSGTGNPPPLAELAAPESAFPNHAPPAIATPDGAPAQLAPAELEDAPETRRTTAAPPPDITPEVAPVSEAQVAPPSFSDALPEPRHFDTAPDLSLDPEPSSLLASSELPSVAEASVAEASVEEPSVSEPARAEASVLAEPAPRTNGLVVIESDERGTYVYWELASPIGNGIEPHWISVVTHCPRGASSERRERRFAVQRGTGAVVLEGLPPHAVVRAKLSRGDAAEAPPLVVAGSVWVRAGAALERAEARFSPLPGLNPAPLAARAAAHLASAAPLYY